MRCRASRDADPPRQDGDRKAHTATASSSFVFARFGILSPSQASLNAIAIALNILSSVGIVLANKWVFAREGFSFGTLLTVIHFVVTFVGLEICARYGLFVRKRIPVRQVAGLCLVFSAFVVLTNLSLQYNSVGFYQMAKVLTTPFIVVVQTIFYGMSFSLRVKAALTVTCVGVGISSASDVQVNVLGTVFALAGVAAAGLYQIWVGTRQKELGVDSFQLLYYQAPISAMMLLFLVPVLDDMGKLSKFEWTASAITSILISASLAFFVNLSTFLIIGKTSAVTYNVVGHFKLCVVVILGFIIFLDPLVWKNALGIAIALAGVFWYSYIKLNNQA
ncbi:triose-phosphate transporter family-domain-containing protein [Entophlyctis helioformis]|nr:triose-phosphate transporter family-domain-containing protein [Entophlyctis helioformis]